MYVYDRVEESASVFAPAEGGPWCEIERIASSVAQTQTDFVSGTIKCLSICYAISAAAAPPPPRPPHRQTQNRHCLFALGHILKVRLQRRRTYDIRYIYTI